MNVTISERTLAVVIQAIGQTTGAQAPTILTQAGLGRFVTTPPLADSPRLVASEEEMTALYRHIYGMLGENGIRLFYRNFGEMVSVGMLQLPEAAVLRAEGQQIPPEQQLAWVVQVIAKWASTAWTPQVIHEDARAWYLTQERCYLCEGITGVRRPLCTAGEVLFARLARAFLGRPVRVEEATCAAMGAPHCTYAIYK